MNIHSLGAAGLAAAIAARQISARDALQHFLSRIERYNPALNAVVALDAERALARADAADAALARGESWGPLHGVPVTIKDALATEGIVTTGGDPQRENRLPQRNAAAVQRYIDAGAIVFGKTNVPFLSSDLQSFNAVYGSSNNPWDHQLTPGGSSGGAAAALAAGLTPLELGSDIGGSIRIPSHFNGVYGHKPSHGLVPYAGHIPPGESIVSEPDLSVIGPLATSVADLSLALDVLLGPDALPASAVTDVSGLRVAIWADDPFCPVDAEIAAAITAVGDALSAAGANVDTRARPAFDATENHRNYRLLLAAVVGASFPAAVLEAAREFVAAGDPDDNSTRMLQMRGATLSHLEWLRENEKRHKTRAAWQDFFDDYDVVICPCACVPAFAHDHLPDMNARTLTINGEQREYLDLVAWPGLTLNAYLPATAVPVGQTAAGMPIGAQIAGPYRGDHTTLWVAQWLEQNYRRFNAPPAYAD